MFQAEKNFFEVFEVFTFLVQQPTERTIVIHDTGIMTILITSQKVQALF